MLENMYTNNITLHSWESVKNLDPLIFWNSSLLAGPSCPLAKPFGERPNGAAAAPRIHRSGSTAAGLATAHSKGLEMARGVSCTNHGK